MNYKEKYEDALEWARAIYPNMPKEDKEDMEIVFPELVESEGERIREKIINLIKKSLEYGGYALHKDEAEDMLEWFEKQGKQKGDKVEPNAEDVDILHRFSFYSYIDEPNVLYLSGLYVNEEYRNKGIATKILKIADEVAARMKFNLIRLKTEISSNAERLYRKNGYNSFKREGNQVWLEKQGEQILNNSAKTCKDEEITVAVIPKFRVGDVIRPKGSTEEHTIESISGECYHGKGWGLHISCDDDYELVEQNPADKVKPKFHEGDWICTDMCLAHIASIKYGTYYFDEGNALAIAFADKYYHLWSIEDAKDGDTLIAPKRDGSEHTEQIFIFKEIKDRDYVKNAVEYYCRVVDNEFYVNEKGFMGQSDDYFAPATKEQRDILFAKMKDAGYEWNAEKKEVKITDFSNHLQYNPDAPSIIEQKPAWSEEDEDIKETIIGELELDKKSVGKINYKAYDRLINWLKSLKDRVKTMEE